MPRACGDWLKTLGRLVERTESPPTFWLWSGIFTIGSVLQRRVWLPYGFDPVYPNLYIMLLANPGRTRKGPPISLAKKFLTEVSSPVSSDSTSRSKLIQEISMKTTHYGAKDSENTHAVSPMAVVSKELSSLLAVNPKEMIEFLTDIYDYHEVWEYTTISRQEERLYGPCVSLFIASTPTYVAGNVPYEAFGAGFFSRIICIHEELPGKSVPIPEITREEEILYRNLVHDLAHSIRDLAGPFYWQPDAREAFETWYNGLDKRYAAVPDERLHGFLARAHIQVLKTAMVLHVAYSDELFYSLSDIQKAIALVEDALASFDSAFAAMGRSTRAVDMKSVMSQIRSAKRLRFSQLLSANWRNTDEEILTKIVGSLRRMGKVRTEPVTEGGFYGEDYWIIWKGN